MWPSLVFLSSPGLLHSLLIWPGALFSQATHDFLIHFSPVFPHMSPDKKRPFLTSFPTRVFFLSFFPSYFLLKTFITTYRVYLFVFSTLLLLCHLVGTQKFLSRYVDIKVWKNREVLSIDRNLRVIGIEEKFKFMGGKKSSMIRVKRFKK